MTMREFLLVERNVEIPSSRDARGAAYALTIASTGKAPIFRGRVDDAGGTLRLRGLMNSSARSLTFHFVDQSEGCLLKGALQSSVWVKLYRRFFLVMLCVYSVVALTDVVRHHLDKLAPALGSLVLMFLGFSAFINAYTWIAVLFTTVHAPH